MSSWTCSCRIGRKPRIESKLPRVLFAPLILSEPCRLAVEDRGPELRRREDKSLLRRRIVNHKQAVGRPKVTQPLPTPLRHESGVCRRLCSRLKLSRHRADGEKD